MQGTARWIGLATAFCGAFVLAGAGVPGAVDAVDHLFLEKQSQGATPLARALLPPAFEAPANAGRERG